MACEQALPFGHVKRALRERASEGPSPSRVLAKVASLTQIGELARAQSRPSYAGNSVSKPENISYFRVVGDLVLFTYFRQGMVALLEIAVVITVMLIAFTPLQSVE